MVNRGKGAIIVNTIQQFLKNDTALIERNLNFMGRIRQQKLLSADYDFFVALHDRDKSRCEVALAKLVSPGIHKKRNTNPLLNQYAKLAWVLGLEGRRKEFADSCRIVACKSEPAICCTLFFPG